MTSSHFYALPYLPDSSVYFSRIHDAPGAVWLDSGQPKASSGRFDICSAWPTASISLNSGISLSEAFNQARELLQQLPQEASPIPDLPFTGGLIGYLGYHGAFASSRHCSQFPQACIGLYPWAFISDHQTQRSGLIFHSSLSVEEQQRLLCLFQEPAPPTSNFFRIKHSFIPEIDSQQYQAAIESVHAHIRQGVCEQINYTQAFSTEYTGDPWNAYKSLREGCPTPYASFFRLSPTEAILSASPECFLQVNQQEIKTWPIKGTRPRGATPEEDARLAFELKNSEKDNAENLMILELMLQELAPLCVPDSLHTPERCQLYSFSNVHHLISCISGTLQKQYDALDALENSFPAGSISGTPKPASLALIDKLEACARDIYCGTIFYLSNHGRFDSSVCIRTLQAFQGTLRCWGGGGITLASDWKAEYQESIDKVRILMQTLEHNHLA